MEFRNDLSVGDFGCFPLLVHAQVLLMRCLFQSRSSDALAHLLVPHSRLSVLAELLALADFKAVHLWFQGNKLGDLIARSLVFEKSNFASVWIIRSSEAARVIRWDFAEIEQTPQLRHIQNFFVAVIRKTIA